MDRKKIIYIGIMIIITVFTSVTYFSYAFFAHREELSGRLNIVAGTLDYKIEAEGLDSNNRISINKKSIKEVEVTVTSLNEIDSKYGLYYKTSNNNIKVYYRNDSTNTPIEEIITGGESKVKIVIVNSSDTNGNIELVINGGFKNNELKKIENTNDIDLGIIAEEIGYTDTYNTGCTNTQCILNKISKIVGE